ncbi:3-oxoacyl-ACP synthase III family protein [Aminivibrio sp.]|uniref:3-oxoacyl-ACP synthase III family protein n=1 Tax=Aminivibrio sp. TaxID=1872489 RepID=UPI001A59CB95|nr:ketoacyl-ACP synthase III [Aminivibrio sp.]MBL3538293.1 ketoacyl-ACP synthase III [Aminivibrio sp.]
MRTAFFLPSGDLSNETLAENYNDPKWSATKIYRKTGIRSRHVVKDELVSDLAVGAAERLFSEYGIDRSTVDFLLLCTQSPDYFLPTTACLVQDRLGLPTSIGALDFNLGCSGFVYGLSLAQGLLSTGAASKIMMIMAETYTRHIHPMDKSTRTIFGDGAAATLLDGDDAARIGKFFLGTDGSGGPNLIVPAGGMARPRSAETSKEETDEGGNIRSLDNLYMNGPEIFSFTLRAVPEMVRKTLEKNNLAGEDIDLYVFHQANRFILENLRERLEIPEERFYIDVEETGNTVSATIPIALRNALDKGLIGEGSKVLVAGFGVGYSWGATVLCL